MMSSQLYARSLLLLVIVGFVSATENYMEYAGLLDEIPDKSPAANIRELYRLVLQRNAFEDAGLGDIPLEHLMIRKSQRSPSLRLRFGRSENRLPIGALSKAMNNIVSSRFND
ncbi:short neuropeptide F [Megalopta genalis]|uniref:short neuropeptide F n=1 Tax=Megalopta genalis TaxID=115081 RepID=UPI00144331F5|nr:short neuropeptide F-like [Megalopta genalis]XP_033326406.1 short neuropeptide F-like [Megalopta genalis]XP_033326407.1 short neuropeptide F-like [Megalopta genalis]